MHAKKNSLATSPVLNCEAHQAKLLYTTQIAGEHKNEGARIL
jgi:hypothetical protein